jgi:hypothetical protein
MNQIKIAVIIFITLLSVLSCTSREEKSYGKVIAKTNNEKELIERVKGTVFDVNRNITLKEAVASNEFSKNITWWIEPGPDKGTFLVYFSYDIDDIEYAMSTNIFTNERVIEKAQWAFRNMSDDAFYDDLTESIVSPIGASNMFTRFISGELRVPTSPGIDDEMFELLGQYFDYKKSEGYNAEAGLIHISRVPDQLPEPYFNVTAAKFTGICFTELSSDVVQFAGFSLLFDFSLPYQDNKEYKGVGINIYDDNISGVKYIFAETITREDGLEFIYQDRNIYEFYPFPCSPVDVEFYRRSGVTSITRPSF